MLCFFTLPSAKGQDSSGGRGANASTNYEALWKQATEWQKKELPQSMQAVVLDIYKNAERERNIPQLLRAGLTLMASREDVSPDSIWIDAQRFESLSEQLNNSS